MFCLLYHGHTGRFERPAIFHSSYKSVLGHHLTLVVVYDTALFFIFLFFMLLAKYIKQRCEPSNLRPPLPRADRPLLRVRERTLSVYADMPTMNIQIRLEISRYLRRLKSVVKLQRFGTGISEYLIWKGYYITKNINTERICVAILLNKM